MAGAMYGISKSTIKGGLNGHVGMGVPTGAATILTQEEENQIRIMALQKR